MIGGTKSPGFYGTEIYNHLTKAQPNFAEQVSSEKFLEDLQNENYASQIYGYLTKLDRSFAKNTSLDDFVEQVKKKEQQPTASAGGDTSLGLSETDGLSPEALESLNQAAETIGLERNPFAPDDPFGYRPEEQARRDEATRKVQEVEDKAQAEALQQRIDAQEGVEIPDFNDVATEKRDGYQVYTDDLLDDMRIAYGPSGFRFEGAVVDGRGDIQVYNDYLGTERSHTLRIRGGLVPTSEAASLQDFLIENIFRHFLNFCQTVLFGDWA